MFTIKQIVVCLVRNRTTLSYLTKDLDVDEVFDFRHVYLDAKPSVRAPHCDHLSVRRTSYQASTDEGGKIERWTEIITQAVHLTEGFGVRISDDGPIK